MKTTKSSAKITGLWAEFRTPDLPNMNRDFQSLRSDILYLVNNYVYQYKRTVLTVGYKTLWLYTNQGCRYNPWDWSLYVLTEYCCLVITSRSVIWAQANKWNFASLDGCAVLHKSFERYFEFVKNLTIFRIYKWNHRLLGSRFFCKFQKTSFCTLCPCFDSNLVKFMSIK
jgi:hypothetical protein